MPSYRDRDNSPFGSDHDGGPRQGGRSGGGFGRGSGSPVPSGPVVEATVKWFNETKGFGFVTLEDGSGDAFLHRSVLDASGHEPPEAGATLKCRLGSGPKGPQVAEIISLDTSTAQAAPPRRMGGPGPGPRMGGGRPPVDMASAYEVSGKVKWFNDDKGFGFVVADDGQKDVFVHKSVLLKAGVSVLAEGQTVKLRVVDSQKGREAVSLSLG